MDIAVLLYEGFDDLDAIGPLEVFGHARSGGGDIDAGLYATETTPVTSSHGTCIRPDGVLGSDSEGNVRVRRTDGDDGWWLPDLVVVPGGGWTDGAAVGARTQVERGTLPEAVAALHADGATVAAVCTGGMVLAAAGLLDGRPATTHHGALADLRETGATVREARVVDDGDIVTAGGVTAGIDLALHLLERRFDRRLADRVADTMAYRRRGEVVVASRED